MYRAVITGCLLTILSACGGGEPEQSKSLPSYYGTLEPFASEAVYFLMTDRFVDGDPANNYPDQGGDYPTWQVPMHADDGRTAYVGYMGGDFKGILDQADYIKDMGFTAIWLTPIVNQPDQAFRGGDPITFGGGLKDGGKTGYHGYWGVNFFEVDEHLPSKDLDFAGLVKGLESEYGLKTVLDVVLNHGSPSYTMPEDQPLFGELYDQDGSLIADHMNLSPEQLKDDEPLHRMFAHKPDINQLSDFNADEPMVLDYFVRAYRHWLDMGVHALRIDTIKHMPLDFWPKFASQIREGRDDLFMFAEAFSYDADFIAQFTLEKNGKISVLDFPQKEAMVKVFETAAGDYRELLNPLYLDKGPYQNPYELMTFYDNHDMARINADEKGYINVHNWLFTSRGIPVIYYGSEAAFMTGAAEHEGNRNYFGIEGINTAKQSPIRQALKDIALVRQQAVALQRGVQINLDFRKDTAVFLRLYQHQGVSQTALVLLNKGNKDANLEVAEVLSSGVWREALTDESRNLSGTSESFLLKPDSVQVWLSDQPISNPALLKWLSSKPD